LFGHAGTPLVVFPTSLGRFFEYEDRGMIAALAHRIGAGRLQVFCVDSVDGESWYNRGVHPKVRVARHNQYESYVLHEVLPFARARNPASDLAVTGCSFGGYHAMNFSLRHPDLVSHCVCMGGAYDVKQFLDGYYDEDCYFVNPHDYLPNLTDDWYLRHYREHTKFVLATGVHDMCWNENERLAAIMRGKGIPHWLDVWGDNTGHDWPWWQQMARKYFS
jgi:esterase/lipase superfamily enzyme